MCKSGTHLPPLKHQPRHTSSHILTRLMIDPSAMSSATESPHHKEYNIHSVEYGPHSHQHSSCSDPPPETGASTPSKKHALSQPDLPPTTCWENSSKHRRPNAPKRNPSVLGPTVTRILLETRSHAQRSTATPRHYAQLQTGFNRNPSRKQRASQLPILIKRRIPKKK